MFNRVAPLMVLIVILAGVALAAMPQNVSYQGFLKDGDGRPVATATDLTFRIYSSASGVNPVWESGTVSVTPENGIYSVPLGADPQPPLPPFDRPYWLGVTAGADAEMRPLQELHAVPYALSSASVGSIGATDIVDLSSNQTIVGTKTFSNTIIGDLSGTADHAVTADTASAVQDGVYTVGSYADPEWISSLAAAKISGTIAASQVDLTTVQKKYARTAVVAVTNGDYANPGTAMGKLGEWCVEPRAQNPCLLKVMPGVYDLGTKSLAMQPYVDIEGSGEGVTRITGAIDSDTAGVVIGAPNAELRSITVENNGAGVASTALYNENASPGLTDVTLIAANPSAQTTFGVMNIGSSPSMRNVTVVVGGQAVCTGVYNYDSSPEISGIRITTGSTCSGYGIHNRSQSSPTITALKAYIPGDQPSYGIYHDGESATVRDSLISATGSTYTLYVTNGSLRFAESELDGGAVHDPGRRITYEGVHDPDSFIHTGIYRIFGSSIVQMGSTSQAGLVIEGIDSQSNLQVWQGIGGHVYATMSPSGILNLPVDGLSIGWDGNSASGQLVAAGGRIGIGTSTPEQLLDVAGTVKAASFSGSGAGLTGVSASSISGVLPIANGGTGAGTAAGALSNLGGVMKSGDTMTGSLSVPTLSVSGDLNLPAYPAIYAGSNPLLLSLGGYNFFAGIFAGNLGTPGWYNTGIGRSALHSIDNGWYNTASGTAALYSNTNGSDNTANGSQALYYNTTGNENTASGTGALYLNSSASNNTAIGAKALYNQSYNGGGTPWESDNTAVGYHALYYNKPTATTNGIKNTAVGSGAMESNTTGSSNTAAGSAALSKNTTAGKNTAVGDSALYYQSYANGGAAWDSLNTAVGYQAMYMNQPTSTSNGNYNVAVGSYALTENSTGYNNAAFGADSLKKNTTGISNTAVGYSALFWNTTGTGNTAVGRNAGLSVGTGSNITLLGYDTNVSDGALTNATAIGYGASVNASNKVRIGNGSVSVIEGQVAWSNPSDIRLKTDIADIPRGLDFITALHPVEFRMKEGNGKKDFGFIAQEIEALLGTGYNVLGIGGDSERTLTLRYTDFIAPLVKAVQEQQRIIEAQRGEIAGMKARLAQIESLLGRR